MSIYPARDKGGKLTGRYCVEVVRNGQRATGRFGSLAEAQAAEKQWKKDFADGKPPHGVKYKVEARAVPHTLRDLARKSEGSLWRGKPIERTNYQKLEIIANVLGNPLLTDITTLSIDTLSKALATRCKPSTHNRYYTAFNSLLKWGKARGYFEGDLPEFPWEDEGEGRLRWITPTEEQRLVAFLRSYDRSDIGDLVTVAIRTGLRRGELLGLEARDIENGWVRLWKTKNKSARSVPINAETAATLRALVAAGMPSLHVLRYFWDKAKKDMGLQDDPDFVFHACRHTCATRLVQANVNLRLVQKWMGHKRIETTLRYAQVSDTMLEDALERYTSSDLSRFDPHLLVAQ